MKLKIPQIAGSLVKGGTVLMNLACLLIPPDMAGKVPLVSFIKTICPWRIASRTPLNDYNSQNIEIVKLPI